MEFFKQASEKEFCAVYIKKSHPWAEVKAYLLDLAQSGDPRTDDNISQNPLFDYFDEKP